MGQWVMHVEGTGIHDNDRSDDAEVMLAAFADELAKYQTVTSVTFTVGSTRELRNATDEGFPEAPPPTTLGACRHAWYYRGH